MFPLKLEAIWEKMLLKVSPNIGQNFLRPIISHQILRWKYDCNYVEDIFYNDEELHTHWNQGQSTS